MTEEINTQKTKKTITTKENCIHTKKRTGSCNITNESYTVSQLEYKPSEVEDDDEEGEGEGAPNITACKC